MRRSAAAQRTHVPEEPDAGMPHVRICGEPGRVTARVYPTPMHVHQLDEFASRDCGKVRVDVAENPSWARSLATTSAPSPNPGTGQT
jgi:hypothetical protein